MNDQIEGFFSGVFFQFEISELIHFSENQMAVPGEIKSSIYTVSYLSYK